MRIPYAIKMYLSCLQAHRIQVFLTLTTDDNDLANDCLSRDELVAAQANRRQYYCPLCRLNGIVPDTLDVVHSEAFPPNLESEVRGTVIWRTTR